MKRFPEAAVILLAAAAMGAAAAVAHRRQRTAELSPYPGVENPGPRGLAALHAWLAETGRDPLVLASPDDRPPPRASLILAAPRAEIEAADAEALLGHAAGGGLFVWAMGPDGAQPELERRLQAFRLRALKPAPPEAPAVALAPHPLFAGLSLRVGGGSVASRLPAALPVGGVVDGAAVYVAAVSVPWGRGEVLILESPEALQNSRLAEPGNLELAARLAARGRVAFDERFLLPRAGGAPPSRRALAALLAQGLAAALLFFWARGRRLGAIRPTPPRSAPRTAADYVASLATLYRRARAEPRLAEEAWRRLRGELWRRAGVPPALSDEEAARRLSRTRPEAALRLGRAAALRAEAARGGPARLLALVRAAAEVEAAVALTPGGRPATVGAAPRRPPSRAGGQAV
ncbi:MAG TPA: DUF4350 domain-containing protein [Anaeromyxobacteraceae bacterium]|nr:DUF4350 domain-containing protein [Anaeromyxobacteraceae bacterium]